MRSKGKVCNRFVDGIAGSNPAEGMNVCLLCLLHVVPPAALLRADCNVSHPALITANYKCRCCQKTQLHSVTNQLHVSATVSIHYEVDPEDIKQSKNTDVMLVGEIGPYKRVIQSM